MTDETTVSVSGGRACPFSCRIPALALLAAFAVGAARADDAMVATEKTWGDPALWQSGTVPGGPGTVIDTGDGTREIRMDETNRVVGGITSTRGTMPANGGNFILSNREQGYPFTDGETPQKVNGQSFLMATNSLTFDNGGASAFLRIDDGNTTAESRQPYRYLFDVPVVLKDSLDVTDSFVGTNQYGTYTTGENNGPIWSVGFGRPVTGAGGLTIDCAAHLNAVAFIGCDNAFTGDIEVKGGLLRALDTSNLPRTGTPFGVGNTITAVSGTGRVDLGGFRTGAGQTLVLKGSCACYSGVRGVLFSTWARPDASAAWEGAVELAGDTRIGGAVNGTSYPSNFYPNDVPGAFEISGPIGERTAGAALTVDNLDTLSPVTLSGTNTFSGGLHLASGTLIAHGGKALGTGGFYFDGGTYRCDSAESADIFTADLRAGASSPRVTVDEGVTVTFHTNLTTCLGNVGFRKYGKGTLVLTNYAHTGDAYLYGRVVFDTTLSTYVKFGEATSWMCDYVRLCDDLRLVTRGDSNVVNHGMWYGNITPGGGVTLRVEDKQKFELYSNTDDTLFGYGNLETDGSGAYFTINKSVDTHTYPDNCSFFVWDRRSWVYFVDGKLAPVPDGLYVTDWTACANKLVDVTPAVASAGSVPAGTTADCLRFDKPNDGNEIVLTLAGDLTLAGHTILVTPDVGSSPVRITGGAIKSTGVIRILNFNTNATLTIESDLAPVSSGTKLASCGPGTTVLKGDKNLDDYIYVVGGRLLADCANAFGKGNLNWNSGYVYLTCGGAIGSAPGAKFDPEADSTNGRKEFVIQDADSFGASGYGIHTAADSEFKMTKRSLPGTPNLFKDGPGQLTYGLTLTWLDVREGSVQVPKFAEGRGRLCVRDGALLKGGAWVNAKQAVANGGGCPSEAQGKRILEVNGRVTVDMTTTTAANSGVRYSYLQTTTEYFAGDGELVITNSTDSSVEWQVDGYRDSLFRGTITPYVSVVRKGFQMPNATLNLPACGSYYAEQNSDDRRSCRLARLTGSGSFRLWNTQTELPSYVWLGADGVADADFAGTLLLEQGAFACGAPQLVKIGTNSQRLSGASNRSDGNFVVRNGGLLAGNDSPATAQTGGAFGNAKIFVGDAETPADGAPAFLIDGAYGVSNEVRVARTSPATARPTVGGTANADGAVFGGALVLYRDAAVHAEAGTTVTFAGALEANGNVLAKTGAGTVVLATEAAPSLDVRAGSVTVPGDLTIPEGATLEVDTSRCTPENAGREFVLVGVGGAVSGRYRLVTSLPDGWRVSYRPHAIVLRKVTGTALFLR